MLESNFYDTIVVMILVLLGLGTFLICGMLSRHAIVSLRLARRGRRAAVLLPIVCEAINDPGQHEEPLMRLRRSDRPVLLPMLLQLALDLRGEELERVAELARKCGLVRAERRRLRSLRGASRVEAAKNLGLLRASDALPDLLRLVERDRELSVRLAAVWATGEIGGSEAVHGLLGNLDDPASGLVRRVQEVLLDTAPNAVIEIVRHTRETQSTTARYAAVELLGALRDPVASELLLELAEAPDTELRTKVVKAAASIGDPRFLDMFRRGLHDSAWRVRCQAATGLGSIGAVDAIDELRVALADEAWWVRFNAASSLAELGHAGRTVLAEATTDGDTRRQEVARYMLVRTGVAPVPA